MHLWLDAVLVAGAMVTSLFFVGFNVELLAAALGLLLLRGLSLLWRSRETGLDIPRTPLALALLLYMAWLALSVLWSPVPSISALTFWWMAAWPIAFWVAAPDPAREILWPRIAVLVLLAALGLVVAGLFQWAVLGEVPSGPFLDQNLYAALLTMVAMATAGYFLRGWPAGKRGPYLLAACFFLLSFAVALTKGRGAALAFVVGFVFLAVFAWKDASRRALAALAMLAVLAFVLGNVAWEGGLVERLATLENPYAAGRNRFRIWEGSWRMLIQDPWLGIGLGMYPLMWPPYRHPEDGSAGYFAHNDYLQIWLDAGLPAFALFLAVILSFAWMCWREWRRGALAPADRTEAAGLAAAFATLLVNSLFTYNFFVVPTLIVAGMILARLHGLCEPPAACWRVVPGRFLGARAYQVLAVLLVLIPLSYFASVSAAELLTRSGVAAAYRGEYEQADRRLDLASRLWENADAILTTHADLYRHILHVTADRDPAMRATLFRAADGWLARAERLNPYRPDGLLIRAELYRQNPDLAGNRWRQQVERDYRRALVLNPMYFHARLAYGRYLLAEGRTAEAREVLEQGIDYPYFDAEPLVAYLALTAALRRQAGDVEGAARLEKRIAKIRADERARRLSESARNSLFRLPAFLRS